MKFIRASLLLLSMSCFSYSYATVKPSVETMMKKSSTIVVAKTMKVDYPGRKNRTIHLKVSDILCGKPYVPSSQKIKFEYTQVGKQDISFINILLSRKPKFFLLKVENEQFSLVDAWFGVLDMTDENRALLANPSCIAEKTPSATHNPFGSKVLPMSPV